MSSSKKKIREQASDPNLILTPHINEWLSEKGDTHYTPEVLEKIVKQLSTPPRDRSGSFSSSSSGYCLRRQVFGYLGIKPNVPIMPQLQLLFNDGKWRHLRWQAMLLDAGLLDSIEVPAYWEEKRSVGSMDGMGYTKDLPLRDDWKNKTFGFELKGMYSRMFEQTKKQGHPPSKHNEQMQRYMLQHRELDMFIYIAENKDTQEWVEYVVEKNQRHIDSAVGEVELLNESVDMSVFPARLPVCQEKKDGKVFTTIRRGMPDMEPRAFEGCPYGGTKSGSLCLKIEDWDDAGQYR